MRSSGCYKEVGDNLYRAVKETILFVLRPKLLTGSVLKSLEVHQAIYKN